MPSPGRHAIAFARKHNLPVFTFDSIHCEKRDNGTWKKHIQYYGGDEHTRWGFPNDDFKNGVVICKSNKDTCFAVKTGNGCRVIVLDFDQADYYDKTIENLGEYHPELSNTLTVKTRKGYHVYLRVPEDKEMFANSTQVWNSPLDIRGEGGNIICPPTTYELDGDEVEYQVYHDTNIAEMSSELYDGLVDAPNVKIFGKSRDVARVATTTTSTSIRRLTELLNLLPPDYTKAYDNWFLIGSIIATETNRSEVGLTLFMEVSRRATGYETTPDEDYITKWDQYELGLTTIGSLIYILRELGIGIPFTTPDTWFGVEDADTIEDMGFESINMTSLQTHGEELTALATKSSKRTDEEDTEYYRLIADNYKIMKDYFEKHHFFNYASECIVRIEPDKTLSYVKNHKTTYADCKLLQAKRSDAFFVSRWIEDPHRLAYRRTDFYPPPRTPRRGVYNSFTPFVIENTPSPDDDGECPEIFEHIKSLVNYDDDSTYYVLSYLAHLVQKPGEKPGVALVFKSDEGAGKSSFFEKIGHVILGERYFIQTEDINKIVGRFSMIRDRLLICKDEMAGKDGYANVESLKHLITEPLVATEKKHIDGEITKNYARILFFTNNDTPLKISESDRRYAVFEASKKYIGNVDYFTTLHKKLSDKVYMRRFYDALMSHDISKWHPDRDRVETEIYKDMKMANISPVKRFMRQYIEEVTWIDTDGTSSTGGTDDNPRTTEHTTDPASLFKYFGKWCLRTRIGLGSNGEEVISMAKFGRQIKKIDGVVQTRSAKRRIYTIDTAQVLSCIPECD